jgi:hypothetical protein
MKMEITTKNKMMIKKITVIIKMKREIQNLKIIRNEKQKRTKNYANIECDLNYIYLFNYSYW